MMLHRAGPVLLDLPFCGTMPLHWRSAEAPLSHDLHGLGLVPNLGMGEQPSLLPSLVGPHRAAACGSPCLEPEGCARTPGRGFRLKMRSASIHRMIASQHQSIDSSQTPEGRHEGSSRTTTCCHRHTHLCFGKPPFWEEGGPLRVNRTHTGFARGARSSMSVAGG